MRSLARAASRSSASRAAVSRAQHRGGARLAVAQRRQIGRGVRLARRGFRFGAGAVGDVAHRGAMGGIRLGHFVLRLHEAQME